MKPILKTFLKPSEKQPEWKSMSRQKTTFTLTLYPVSEQGTYLSQTPLLQSNCKNDIRDVCSTDDFLTFCWLCWFCWSFWHPSHYYIWYSKKRLLSENMQHVRSFSVFVSEAELSRTYKWMGFGLGLGWKYLCTPSVWEPSVLITDKMLQLWIIGLIEQRYEDDENHKIMTIWSSTLSFHPARLLVQLSELQENVSG